MTYIPKQDKIIKGSIVELTRAVESMSGSFTKGSIVTVTSVTSRGYDFEDEEGNRVIECFGDCCKLKS